VHGFPESSVSSVWFSSARFVSRSSRSQFYISCSLCFVLVFLVILSVFFENTGFMKAGPRQSQFEPTEGKTVKFSDVHGVDEAKDVCLIGPRSNLYLESDPEFRSCKMLWLFSKILQRSHLLVVNYPKVYCLPGQSNS
jgi:hypothetical protein